MDQQLINTGTVPNDGTGDNQLICWTKTNANFSELYPLLTGSGSVLFTGNKAYTGSGVSSAVNSWMFMSGAQLSGISANSVTSGTTSPFQLYISGDTVDTTTLGTGLLR